MRSRPTALFAAILAACAALALASCGGGDTTTVIQQTAPTPGATDGPSGQLELGMIGLVEQGMLPAQVETLFGKPDRTERFQGCPLYGEGRGVLAWIWDMPEGGVVQLDFDGDTEELASWSTASPAIPSLKGDRVGDPFSQVLKRWGGDLHPLNLEQQSTEENGLWYVAALSGNELLFAVEDGKVVTITGGRIPVCE